MIKYWKTEVWNICHGIETPVIQLQGQTSKQKVSIQGYCKIVQSKNKIILRTIVTNYYMQTFSNEFTKLLQETKPCC